MQRQGRSGAEARKAPVASPSLAQPAPSWVGCLKARQVWARLAHGKAASRQELCQIRPLSRAGACSTGGTLGSGKQGFQLEGSGRPPLPLRRPASLLALHSPIRRGSRAPPAGLASGAASLSWGCGREPRHAGSGPNHRHMSVLGRRVLGNLRLSCTCWAPTESASRCAGLQTPARGPGSLSSPCGDESGRPSNRSRIPALAFPFPLTELSLLEPWQCACHRPLSPPQGRLGPRCKGKAGAELRTGRRQWRLPALRSLLLPGEGA